MHACDVAARRGPGPSLASPCGWNRGSQRVAQGGGEKDPDCYTREATANSERKRGVEGNNTNQENWKTAGLDADRENTPHMTAETTPSVSFCYQAIKLLGENNLPVKPRQHTRL